MNQNTLYKWARWYLREGFSVIPIKPKSKEALIPWTTYQNRLPSEKEIEDWWTKYPHANIGIVTGRISRICVLEVDEENALKDKHIPITPQAVSGGKGLPHIYFRYKEVMNNYKCKENGRELFSIRVDGQYVVAPPSIHSSGKKYKWVGGLKIYEVELQYPPDWIIALTKNVERVYQSNSSSTRTPASWKSKRKVFVELLSKYWDEGKRQDLSMSAAGYLAKLQIPWEDTKELIIEIAEKCNDSEIRQRIASIRSTYEKINEGRAVIGFKGLEAILSKDDLNKLTNLFSDQEYRIKGLTVEQIKLTKIDQNRFIIKPSIAMREGITVISGDPGVGKTWLTLDIARCVSTGIKLFGQFDTEVGKVAYFDQENPFSVLKEKIDLLDIPNRNCRFYHFQNINIERNYEEVLNIASDSDLLIFDSLTQFHTRNEDKASDIKVVMNKFKLIGKQTNSAIILLHQRRKPGQFEKSELYSARGSLQIIYDADMAFTLRKVKHEGRVLEATKSRVVKEPNPFKFEIEQSEGNKIKLKYLGEYIEIESKRERAETMVPIILQDSADPIPIDKLQSELMEKGLDVSEATLRPIIKDLEKGKIITSTLGAKGKKYYSYVHDDQADNQIDDEVEQYMKETEAF